LPAFTQQRLFDDEALRAIQAQLLMNPDAGDLIPVHTDCASYVPR